jgi:hypothetical protein
MKEFYPIITALNTVVFISLFAYYAAVYLNVVFTFKYLTTSDVSYYDPTLMGLLGSDYSNRYSWEWWVFLSDILRVLVPIMYEFMVVTTVMYNNKSVRDIVALSTVLILVGEVLKLIWRGYVWWFCVDFQFCRNFNENNCKQKFDCPANFIWQWAFLYGLAFVVILILYTLLLSIFDSYAGDYQKELEEKGFDKRFLEGDTKEEKEKLKSNIPGYSQIRRLYKKLNRTQKLEFLGFSPKKM